MKPTNIKIKLVTYSCKGLPTISTLFRQFSRHRFTLHYHQFQSNIRVIETSTYASHGNAMRSEIEIENRNAK